MQGGTFCFQEIGEADEWITTIKMIVKPSNDKQGIKISGHLDNVHGALYIQAIFELKINDNVVYTINVTDENNALLLKARASVVHI